MMTSDEKEEMFDDWEDEGFPSDDNDGFPEDADDGAFENAAPQQKPAKKKGGGGVLLFLLILLGSAGGGFYYLTTPGGAPYREYLPEAVRGFLPAAEAPKPKVAATPKDQHVADVLDGEIEPSGTQNTADNIDPLGFQAPPMPSLSDTEDMTAESENTESFATFGDMAKDEAAEDETAASDDAGDVVAWGSETPSEDSATALSFDSADDTETAAVDATPAVDETSAPLTADEKPETVTAPEDNASSFAAATNQAPAVKTEQLIDLEDRMSVLEKAVHSLEKTVVTKKDLAGLQSNVSSLQADIKALRSELKKTASVARSAASAPRAASSPSTSTTTAVQPAKTVKTAPKREWVMVSAQPGTAWISEKGSSSKREVSVGDTVPGLGRITSIAPSAGSGLWIVKGTQGTLQQ